MKLFDGLPLWGATAILGVIVVIGIYAAGHYHDLLWFLIAVAVTVVLGVLYLREYTQRPLEEKPVLVPGSMASLSAGAATDRPALRGTPAPELVDDDSDFDDPVIEADRIDSGEVVPDRADDGAPSGPPKTAGPPTPP